jgi:hypothetical protein
MNHWCLTISVRRLCVHLLWSALPLGHISIDCVNMSETEKGPASLVGAAENFLSLQGSSEKKKKKKIRLNTKKFKFIFIKIKFILIIDFITIKLSECLYVHISAITIESLHNRSVWTSFRFKCTKPALRRLELDLRVLIQHVLLSNTY